MHMKYRREIDGLRAVAILAVLAFHLDVKSFAGGFVGVDIFFVISGYLITSVIRSHSIAGTFRFSEFYLRRMRRLFPAMFVTVLVTFVLGAFLMSPVAFGYLSSSALAAVLSVSNVTFWLQSGYFDESSWTKPLLHTWSLGIEEQFYLLWPAAIVLLLRCREHVAPIVIGAIGIASAVIAEAWLRLSPDAVFFLLPFRICEFALGALLVWAPANSGRAPLLTEAGFAAGFSAIATSILIFDSDTKFPGVASLLPCLGAALCICCGRAFIARVTLANSAAVAIGRISYSLYLVHWPAVVFSKYYLLRDLTNTETILVLFAIFVLAIALFRYAEQPFRSRGSIISIASPRKSWIVATVCVALLAVPTISAQVDGWPWRVRENGFSAKPFDLDNTIYGGVDCKEARCESTGNPAHVKVYVVGDSHARGLYAGLVHSFPSVNFIFFVSDACGFYSAGFYAAYSRTGVDCAGLRRRAFDEIAQTSSPVIIFQLWRSYARLRHFPTDHREAAFQTTKTPLFAAFAAAQIEALKSRLQSRSVMVVGGVPTFANIGSPEDCFSRPLQSPICATSPRLTVVDRVNADFNSAVAAIPNKTFIWIDPFRYLCDSTHCRNMTPDGKTIYADEDHLSVWGSEYVVSLFKSVLAREIMNEANVE